MSGFEVLEVPDTCGVRRRSGAGGAVVGRRGNRRSARRLAELRSRLACFGHSFALTDPGPVRRRH